ncbi:MAG TPA: ABC transporter permease [Gaiella sp.]|uniref:ABC transporter permease n=1 Tax=Gaiella sp. TaxID=2663207 RepID=UPI002D7E9A9A|nr:ABC transporter permease [Gaiella sp.]HET9289291.1 ABC transporter permease [Gaiella sp.]
MLGFIGRRVLLTIPTIIGISIIIFLMVRLMPGDIIDVLFSGDVTATEEVKQQAREDLGLSGSYPEQYWNWASGVVQGDLGDSYRNTEPVSDVLLRALPITLELMILALLIAVLIGVPLGVISAVRRDSAGDYASRVGGLIGISIPNFWLATLLLLFTSRVFGWVPPLGHISFFDDPIGNLSQFVLPAISISVFTLAIVMRMVRATMLEVMSQDYVRTARAKGVRRRLVVYRHALRNALVPVVTVIGFEVGILMGGAAIVELIFGLPGVGYVLLQAIFNRDYPLVQGATLLIAVIFVLANLLVDIVYGWLDPRIVQE